jgi:capsular exopolysaccharide synthesis family protein
MDVNEVLAIAWKRWWVVLVVLLAAGGASAAFASSQPKEYDSAAVLALTPDLTKGQGPLSADDTNVLMRTYAEMAKGAVVRKRAEEIYGHALPGRVDAAADAGTGILRIDVRAPKPTTAAAAATAVASAFTEAIADNKLLTAKVVTPPEAPSTPVAPRRTLIVGAALLVGLLCGLLLACALESLRRRIVTEADIAEHTSAPVVGWLPRERALASKKTRTAWDIVGEVPLKEGFRALRTNLEALLDDYHSCLAVTSSEGGEGSSLVVANLGIAFAQVGIETVIIDADLRRPCQHEIFGLTNETGLSTVLASSQKVELQQTRHSGLWVVTSGPALHDPTESLHMGFSSVIEELRHDALVLVDTPPVHSASDARLIASKVDGVLLVVGAGRPSPAVFRSALAKLQLVGARVIGVVINRGEPDAEAGRSRGGDERSALAPRSSEAGGGRALQPREDP